MSSKVPKIRTFIIKTLIRDADLNLAPTEPIFSSGLLDSFSVVQLMRWLEDEYKIKIEVSDVTLADFDTVRKIETLVDRLLTRGA